MLKKMEKGAGGEPAQRGVGIGNPSNPLLGVRQTQRIFGVGIWRLVGKRELTGFVGYGGSFLAPVGQDAFSPLAKVANSVVLKLVLFVGLEKSFLTQHCC